MANAEWNDEFQHASLQNLVDIGSDHGPICLTLNPSQASLVTTFKFYDTWLKEASCIEKELRMPEKKDIFGKLLANKLKKSLENIVSPLQSTFLSSRQISDNIIVAHEIVHSMKKSKKKVGNIGLKIDMSKAFDRVNWNFLIKTMRTFGYSEDWCNLIYQCISTTSIDVLLNGNPCAEFKPTRGLRQGDPLSPYLFIF